MSFKWQHFSKTHHHFPLRNIFHRRVQKRCIEAIILLFAFASLTIEAFHTIPSSTNNGAFRRAYPISSLRHFSFGSTYISKSQNILEMNTKGNASTNDIKNETNIVQEKHLMKAINLLQAELNFNKKSDASLLFESKPQLYKIYFDCINAEESSNNENSKKKLQVQNKPQTPIQLIRTHVGIGRERLRNMVVKHPDLLAPILLQFTQNGGDPVLKSTIDILKQDLDVSDKQIKAMEKSAPNVLRRIYRLDLRRKLHFLHNLLIPEQNVKTTSTSSTAKSRNKSKSNPGLKQLQKVMLKRPQLLAYSTDNLRSTVIFFTDELELSDKQLAKMVSSMPLVLTYSVDKNLRPTIEFLYEFIGCSEEQVTKIVYRYPQVLTQSVKSLAPKVDHLRNAFHLMEWDDLPRIITLFPPLLWLSEANLNNKILFLTKELKLSDEELRSIIVTMPALLGLSVECNLRPKINFFLQSEDTEEEASSIAMLETFSDSETEDDIEEVWERGGGGGLTRNELKDFVIYQPALLAYSLENRIIPRVKRMSEVNISLSFSPPYVLSITDEKFDQWLTMQSSSWTVL